MIMIRKFIFNFRNFCVIICCCFTKLVILGILFSKSDFIAVNAEFVGNPPILGYLVFYPLFQ